MNPAANWFRILRGSWDRQGQWTNAFPSASCGPRAKEGASRLPRRGFAKVGAHASSETDAANATDDWRLRVGCPALTVSFLPLAQVSFRTSGNCRDDP